jgi:hypothetical protein
MLAKFKDESRKPEQLNKKEWLEGKFLNQPSDIASSLPTISTSSPVRYRLVPHATEHGRCRER